MPIFEIRPGNLVPLTETTFQVAGFRERADLQRLLRQRIDTLGEDLLVLAEEFSNWVDSARRIDLLCLDKDASLVVIELKRDQDGAHMELQALRYAAMVSEMTFDQAVGALASSGLSEEWARTEILGFLGWAVAKESEFAQKVRIILASHDFSKELTTCVLWLTRTLELDIRCIRLRPYVLEDGRHLLDVEQLIPLPEAGDIRVRIGDKARAIQQDQERHTLRRAFLQPLAQLARENGLNFGRAPNLNTSALAASIGRSGFSIAFVAGMDQSRSELLIFGDRAKERYDQVIAHRDTIEAEFGGELKWMKKDATDQCRVYSEVHGGYRSPESDWPSIYDQLVDAMVRLDRSVRRYVNEL